MFLLTSLEYYQACIHFSLFLEIMAELFHDNKPQFFVFDKFYFQDVDDCLEKYSKSSTLYVGNLNPETTEDRICSTFSAVGPVKQVILGQNRFTKEPCGFAFVEYFDHQSAVAGLKYLTDTVCDGNIIRCDLDSGFEAGRQYGRSKTGGQRREFINGPKESESYSSNSNKNNNEGSRKRQRYDDDDYNNGRDRYKRSRDYDEDDRRGNYRQNSDRYQRRQY